MNISPLLLVLLTTVPQNLLGQSDTTEKVFRLDITAGFYHQMAIPSAGEPREIVLPAYLAQRRSQEPDLAKTWDLNNNLATDNPLGHGASFFRFHTWYNVNADIALYGSLEVSNGGFSWGPYNSFNTAILPRYWAVYKKSFKAVKLPFECSVKIGNFENFKNYEGLTMYNLDMQGVVADIGYKNIHFMSTSVTDLQKSIGLNIDGSRNYKIFVEDIRAGKKWKWNIQAGIQKLLSTPVGASMGIFSTAIYNGSFRCYVEASYRNSEMFEASSNCAILCGFRGRSKFRDIQMRYSLEYRHYGGGFNYNFRNEVSTHYRRIDKGSGGNFIGDQIYPVSYLNRPFSQWAVFTEYNEKCWVDGLTLNAQIDYSLGKKVKWILDLDMNLVAADSEHPFLYPFYKTGVKASAGKETYILLALTNKTMNLDNFYTSYYCLKRPVFQFEMRRDIKL